MGGAGGGGGAYSGSAGPGPGPGPPSAGGPPSDPEGSSGYASGADLRVSVVRDASAGEPPAPPARTASQGAPVGWVERAGDSEDFEAEDLEAESLASDDLGSAFGRPAGAGPGGGPGGLTSRILGASRGGAGAWGSPGAGGADARGDDPEDAYIRDLEMEELEFDDMGLGAGDAGSWGAPGAASSAGLGGGSGEDSDVFADAPEAELLAERQALERQLARGTLDAFDADLARETIQGIDRHLAKAARAREVRRGT